MATIYCPKVGFELTVFFKNQLLPGVLDWFAIGMAAVLLYCVFRVQREYARANTLTMMLFVYSSISLVSAFSTTSPTGAIAVIWAVVAVALVPVVRRVLKSAEVGWKRLLLRYDAIRYAAVVWLFSILFIGSGGAYVQLDWILSVQVILTVLAMNRMFTIGDLPTWTPDGKTTVGWIRWIMAYCVGGSLIGWVTETSDAVLLALASSVWVGLLLEEPPSAKVLTAELNGVFGSGVATTLHIVLLKTPVWTSLPAIHIVALFGYGAFCLFVLHVWTRGKRHFTSLEDLLRRVGRTGEGNPGR